ncbi:hypothetical protein [Corynebacterium sp.]|nr:hypothetical protein [Corynebacterium sp.]MDO5077508.1 hypothetical protein [Corynebacterium sp.]
MFGLPTFTVVAVVGVSVFWILYTAAFWVISKDWHLADEVETGANA